jgi:DNA ligase (NAD+)
VEDYADLYRLTVDELARLPRFAEKSARNLVAAIAASRSRGLARLLNGLGIPLVGEHVARVLAERFGTLERLAASSADELRAIPGIGSEIAESVTTFFGDPGNRRLCARLAAAGVATREPRTTGGGPLAGKTFVLTGTLPHLDRDAVREMIQQAGGRVTDSVSGKTDYLVVGEAPGSKLDEGRRLGTAIIDEPALLTMARGG